MYKSKRMQVLATAALLTLFSGLPTAEAQATQALFAVNVPLESIGSATNAGAITLLSMTSSGSAAGSKGIHQGSPGVPGANETDDYFGGATAWGDVDGNGTDDLIVSVPFEDIGSKTDAGAITVLYDAGSGSYTSAASLHQGSPGVVGANEVGDLWGFSVASGDLDGDGYDDVVVGAPYEDIKNDIDTGAITVLFGGPGGLSGFGSKAFHQDTSGVPGVNEDDDTFGFSVAVAGGANFVPYVAVGAPGEDIGNVVDAGAVTLFGTGNAGLVPVSPSLYPGASASNVRPAMPLAPGVGDRFGYTLSSDDASIIIGAPFADVNGAVDAGYVMVYNGFPANAFIQEYFQGLIGPNHLFGWSTASVFDGSVFSFVVGAPGTPVSGEQGAGVVSMFSSGSVGFAELHQDSPGVPGVAETGDNFGSHVDILLDGTIFVGVTGEDIGSKTDTGAGTVLFGPLGNPGSVDIHSVHQDTPGVPGKNETGDNWGA